jgi:hypothetical protein
MKQNRAHNTVSLFFIIISTKITLHHITIQKQIENIHDRAVEDLKMRFINYLSTIFVISFLFVICFLTTLQALR